MKKRTKRTLGKTARMLISAATFVPVIGDVIGNARDFHDDLKELALDEAEYNRILEGIRNIKAPESLNEDDASRMEAAIISLLENENMEIENGYMTEAGIKGLKNDLQKAVFEDRPVDSSITDYISTVVEFIGLPFVLKYLMDPEDLGVALQGKVLELDGRVENLEKNPDKMLEEKIVDAIHKSADDNKNEIKQEVSAVKMGVDELLALTRKSIEPSSQQYPSRFTETLFLEEDNNSQVTLAPMCASSLNMWFTENAFVDFDRMEVRFSDGRTKSFPGVNVGKLLLYLAENKTKNLFSADELIQGIWGNGDAAYGYSKSNLHTVINKMRKLLMCDASEVLCYDSDIKKYRLNLPLEKTLLVGKELECLGQPETQPSADLEPEDFGQPEALPSADLEPEDFGQPEALPSADLEPDDFGQPEVLPSADLEPEDSGQLDMSLLRKAVDIGFGIKILLICMVGILLYNLVPLIYEYEIDKPGTVIHPLVALGIIITLILMIIVGVVGFFNDGNGQVIEAHVLKMTDYKKAPYHWIKSELRRLASKTHVRRTAQRIIMLSGIVLICGIVLTHCSDCTEDCFFRDYQTSETSMAALEENTSEESASEESTSEEIVFEESISEGTIDFKLDKNNLTLNTDGESSTYQLGVCIDDLHLIPGEPLDEFADNIMRLFYEGNLEWSSSDTTVATVSDGLVTAIGDGEATITVSYNEYSAVCDVSVKTDYDYAWSSWSDWSTEPIVPSDSVEVETRNWDENTLTYDMVSYKTWDEETDEVQYRNYSIGDDYQFYGLSKSHGEICLRLYDVVASKLYYEEEVPPGVKQSDGFHGVNKADAFGYSITAGSVLSQIFFVENVYFWEANKTYYRFRELKKTPVIYNNVNVKYPMSSKRTTMSKYSSLLYDVLFRIIHLTFQRLDNSLKSWYNIFVSL